MTNKIQDVELKDGTHTNYFHDGDRHVFFDNVTAMSRFQFWIVIFIAILVILMSAFQVITISDALNTVYHEVQEINYKVDFLLAQSGEELVYIPNAEET